MEKYQIFDLNQTNPVPDRLIEEFYTPPTSLNNERSLRQLRDSLHF